MATANPTCRQTGFRGISPLNYSIFTNDVLNFPIYDSFLNFQSLNLLSVGSNLTWSISSFPSFAMFSKKFDYIAGTTKYKYVLRIDKDKLDQNERLTIPSHALSPQGLELHNIIGETYDWWYIVSLSRFLNERGDFKLEYARALEDHENENGDWVWTPIAPVGLGQSSQVPQ